MVDEAPRRETDSERAWRLWAARHANTLKAEAEYHQDAERGDEFLNAHMRSREERLSRLQRLIDKHLPEAGKDRTEAEVFDLMLNDTLPVMSRTTLDSSLTKLLKALQTIAEHEDVYREIIRGTVEQNWDAPGEWETVHEIFEFVGAMRSAASNGTLPRALDTYERMARRAMMRHTYDRRNINWHAVAAVRNLRRIWEISKNEPAPLRALNPASPFAEYLRDGFEFLEIKGDPVSAFKRWARLADENGYEDDLV